MMSPELSEAENSTAVVGKRADEEQFTSTDEDSGICGIQIIDSRDDLFAEQEYEQRPLSSESIGKKEVDEVKNQNDEAAANGANDDTVSAAVQMVTELRQALVTLRGINIHLQRENDMVKEENTTLANTVHRVTGAVTTLREENEQLREELELLKTGKADITPSNDITSSSLSDVSSATTSLFGDDIFEFDERSHANDLNPLSLTIDTEFQQYIPISQLGSEDSDDIQDNEETIKLIDEFGKPNLRSDLRQSIKSLDALYDIDELKITTTEDDEDVTLYMKLELKRGECNEIQKDLEKIAQVFWEQTEELRQRQSRIEQLHTKNEELKEVDAMWAHVKKMDKEDDERWEQCESSLFEREELKASVVEKSHEIAELKEKLRNAPCPKAVQSRMNDIQEDLKSLLDELKASVIDKSNAIAELKAKLRNAPCPEWVQSRMDNIQEDVKALITERDELRVSVGVKSHQIAELKAKLQNAPCPECVQSRMDDMMEDLKQMKKEQHWHKQE